MDSGHRRRATIVAMPGDPCQIAIRRWIAQERLRVALAAPVVIIPKNFGMEICTG